MSRELHLAGFLIASHVTHSHAAWRHPASETDYLGPDYYTRVAKTLERGKFDFLFFADLLATPVRYGNDIRVPLSSGTQASATIDPSLVAAVLAGVTDKIGLAITKSTTYFHPYELARIFATLDHLSRGRAGWNVVTSLNQAEAQNFGIENHLGHDERYARAQEFLEVAYKLWGSWERDALVQNKESGLFADPDKVHTVDHDGEFFKTRGPLTVPHSPQSRPVIFQAGSSSTGKDFAARWADAIFEIDPTKEGRRAYYDDVKSRASNFGRNPDDIKIFPSFVPFVGETESIAREKQAFHNELADPISGLITLSVHTDHDFSQYDLDAPIEEVTVPGSQGLFDVAHRLSDKDSLTLRDIGKLYAQGVLLPQFVGTASQIADQIEEGFNGGEADGYILSAAQAPGTFDDFVDLVVPELQRRGLFRTDYTGTTLRDHLGLADASLEVRSAPVRA
ncbi:LLM class flavin-dependent oxidoreductase [Rhodococcus sp. BP-252]|uniref:LLM class flavin-dependent oxidoreductase n=1 Tax=unclassified Rhodococcus (in: high G+C Gram-positive bacteria) TaxID=192944 RepID=UPI0014309503|nr:MULTISPECIES: LLM class flavin-dependent oxidoreductase [unclassified Rhodococcus (in: high G+C Gram-positive bacteria)]MBY6412253.1 LLM class flavin-dependent oxidoreductase [Rhodococcus sp. BP-320]MBY6416833.1 LLM class flavin-dependent oxidoreductase [Rhodococcus sp. BP-321]MBY6421629.1 LLM class flavin-dependent oxidoreductase [Rhodococcus sp. BP-324]MBY6426895.1 LLM class flavin-dependent oxidoreductase [Rhodococcus sp. BP-323]MBY6432061.1 LLM class flavin-dependent oxidoreductase [Rho